MLFAVLILSGLFNNLESSYVNEMGQNVHEIHKRDVYEDAIKLCEGKTMRQCKKEKPEELKQCKICGLINPVAQSGLKPYSGQDKDPGIVILGEVVKPPYKFPWMVALMKSSKRKTCGGAIISDRYILTAGHCVTVYGKNDKFKRFLRPDELTIGFLTSTFEVDPGHKIEKIIRHPGYNPTKMDNDIALLQLSQKITCGPFKIPICLPVALANFNVDDAKNITFEITGWGTVQGKNPKYPKQLQHGAAKIVSYSECKRHTTYKLEKVAYCLKGRNNQRPCYGDSGGSLFFRHNKKYVSVGVASLHTALECSEGKPFIYASIPKALPWIKKVISSQENQQENKTESKQENKKESKQENKKESKQENKKESQHESQEESQQESQEESQQESHQESLQESQEESQQESQQENQHEKLQENQQDCQQENQQECQRKCQQKCQQDCQIQQESIFKRVKDR